MITARINFLNNSHIADLSRPPVEVYDRLQRAGILTAPNLIMLDNARTLKIELFSEDNTDEKILGLVNKKSDTLGRLMRFKMYSPDKVLAQLNDLKREHLHFRADEYQSSAAQRFITEDEIDKLFLRGSGMDRGKIRIYLYFQEHTDTKERIAFLKQEYGTGGHSGGLFNEWHDAKGITFSRSDILSPLAKVNISWNAAAKRIDNLIKSGRYMSEKEIAEDIPIYMAEQEQRRIKDEKYQYLRNMSDLSPEELRETLPKRVRYLIDLKENYERKFLGDYGVEHLINETEIGTEACGYANTRVRKAVIAGETNGYGYTLLSAITQNAIRDLRCEWLQNNIVE